MAAMIKFAKRNCFMIVKTLFLVKEIHRIGTQSFRGKKSLPENRAIYRNILRIAENSPGGRRGAGGGERAAGSGRRRGAGGGERAAGSGRRGAGGGQRATPGGRRRDPHASRGRATFPDLA
jgi:hypothetical protein